ncbi:hemolysin [Thermoplasmatales archaeon ex4484_30]|nr:MAG: HlyC/CorC family transporter [Thermoplasmata archaeon]OYT60603.1 MAG: hemolysin [Thermoplasmatales archaeon ex4484_30]
MMWIIAIIVICILIILSAFFAAAEMAFVSIDRIKVRQESTNGAKNAVLLEKLLERADEVVSAIVVCNNLVNIGASILAGALVTSWLGNVGAGVGISTAVMTLLIVIFGETTPKSFGLNNEQFAFKVAGTLFIIWKVFSPVAKSFAVISNGILRLLGKERRKKAIVTEEEIKTMLDLGVEDGTIEQDEKELVEEIFDFDETKAMEIYVPIEEVVSLHEDDTVEKLVKKAVETGYSRFPVYRENRDDIVGMVHIKDALLKDKDTPIKEIMRNILKITPKMKIDDVLREMQKRKVHMAVIQSKDGKTRGLVTLEDLIEEIFGEIRDEHDIK